MNNKIPNSRFQDHDHLCGRKWPPFSPKKMTFASDAHIYRFVYIFSFSSMTRLRNAEDEFFGYYRAPTALREESLVIWYSRRRFWCSFFFSFFFQQRDGAEAFSHRCHEEGFVEQVEVQSKKSNQDYHTRLWWRKKFGTEYRSSKRYISTWLSACCRLGRVGRTFIGDPSLGLSNHDTW